MGWADLFGGFRGYWLWTSLVYVAGLMLLSLSANAELPRWVGRFVQVSPEFLALTARDALAGAAGAPAARGGGGAAATAAGLPAAALRMLVSNGVLSAWRPLDRDQIVVPVAPAAAGPGRAAAAGAAARSFFASLVRSAGAAQPGAQQGPDETPAAGRATATGAAPPAPSAAPPEDDQRNATI